MKLVANIQLRPTKDQTAMLRDTLERCNAACNWLSGRAFETGKIRQYDLHKLAYRDCREHFNLTAQVAVRCIAKVADAYKIDHETQRTFRKHAAQPYDDRILRFIANDQVSIWTLIGRMKLPFVCGERQRKLLVFRKGEVDLMLVKGKWYLACVCEIPDPSEINVKDVLGIDLGIVNIAFDSEGRSYAGTQVERVRGKLAKRKAALQRCGSKAAKRRLKKLAGKEARFRKHVNHCISKEIVACAERSSLAIGVEDLTHIRKRVKARRAQRNRLHSWSFAQLRAFLAYKAKRAGLPIIAVDPRNTSKGCSCCKLIDKRNRPDQATFSCIGCSHSEPADLNAARNIAFLARAALVTRPRVLALN